MQKGADSCTSTYNRRKTTLRRQTDTTNRRTNTQRKEANWAHALKFYRKYNQCLHRNASKFCTCNNPQRSWLGHSWRANQIPGGSVQFNHSVVSNSLWSDGLWHIRLPCPSPTSRDCSNSCLLSQWCHPTISSILCRPLLLLPSIFPSIRVFSSESVIHIRWPKYWGFSFCISPSNEYSGLISFRMDWLDLLAIQGTLRSLLQFHSSKASILWLSDFFIVQLSHSYLTTGKTVA